MSDNLFFVCLYLENSFFLLNTWNLNKFMSNEARAFSPRFEKVLMNKKCDSQKLKDAFHFDSMIEP